MTTNTRVVIRPPHGELEFASYFSLRYRVLRMPLGYEPDSANDEDEPSSWHFAAYMGDETVGVARLNRQPNGEFWIRWVAVDPNQRGRHIGASLMKGVEAEARRQQAARVELNARDTALKFYTKLGYQVVGPAFAVRDAAGKAVITQTRMYKNL